MLAPSGDVALIANVDVTFSLPSVGVPLTDVYARGTPYVGVPPSGSVARTGT